MTGAQADAAASTTPAVVRLLEDAPGSQGREPAFVFDGVQLCEPARAAGIVLPRGGAARARALLRQGVAQVFLGEAALLDSTIVGTLCAEFGSARVGVHVPARRVEVSWAMDSFANADFRVMVPSRCETCWEILRPDGSGTGTRPDWWIGEMFKLGASSALLQVDIGDDADLNLLAGMTACWSDRIWVAPLRDTAPDLDAWVELAGARRLAVPDGLLRDRVALARGSPATREGEG